MFGKLENCVISTNEVVSCLGSEGFGVCRLGSGWGPGDAIFMQF